MRYRVMFLLSVLFVAACKDKPLPNQEMIDLLKASAKTDHNHENVFSPEAKIEYCDSILNTDLGEDVRIATLEKKANSLLQLGEEQKAIDIYQGLLDKISLGNLQQRQVIIKGLANAYLRWGDRTNCIHNHTAESCISLSPGVVCIAIRRAPRRPLNYIRTYWLTTRMIWNQDGC